MVQHRVLPCLHKCFGSAVGKQGRDESGRHYVVEVTVKAVPAQYVQNLGLGIYRGIGDVAVCRIVAADCKRRAEGERVDVATQHTLYAHHRHAPLCVPPILPDFKRIRLCLTAFLHLHDKQELAQHLVFSARGEDGEILLLRKFALESLAHFQPCTALGAGAAVAWLCHKPAVSAVHAGGATFRLVGVDLPQNKRGEIALTYVYGIGRSSSAKILDKAGVDRDVKVKDWTDDQAAKIREIIGAEYKVEGDLRSEVQLNIKRLMDIGCYRGVRHRIGLPVRGQSTKNNARTRKGRKKTVANKKKATK